MFVIVLFVFGIFIKSNEFKINFINILVLGEILNLFDLIVIGLIWWRNTKRIRFKDIPEKNYTKILNIILILLYEGVFMYLLVALIYRIILTII